MNIQFDPILSGILAVATVLAYLRKPSHPIQITVPRPSPPVIHCHPAEQAQAPQVTVHVAPSEVPPVRFLVPADVSRVAQDQHRAAILHRQPDLSWQEVGHVDFEDRLHPPDRILQELATEGRAVRWPDGTIQHG